jgi:hypothetical protein
VNKPDASVGREHPEIARYGELGAAAQRIAIECCHHRQRKAPYRIERGPRLGGHLGCLPSRAHVAEVAQIAAGRETLVPGTAKTGD